MTLVLLAILIFGGVLAFGVYMLRWQEKKGEALLVAWAGQQHLRILECEAANPPGTGPMDRNAANKQILYRIKAVDESGEVRQGIVRIGSPLGGVMSDDITVEWGP